MGKGERISQLMTEFSGDAVDPDQTDVASHPFYRAFFHWWNEQRYYEAHDVLEQLWLKTKSPDADYFKGLIQAAGAFVHLQKRYVVEARLQRLLKCVFNPGALPQAQQ
ncbi:MAG: hypothetical protein DME89_12830 [Verrucomicrobia bacterium]|nr:MAG: hypothetical protein DME89_12830 [Verrucomicrobiota bacterium]